MPALTKKKKPSHRTSTGRRASGTGRAKKAKTDWRTDSEGYRIHHKIVDSARDVKAFADRNKGALKKLGWVFATGAMAADAAKKARAKTEASATARKTSKGGRGTEKLNQGKGRKR
jgi:hypothetical protein